MEAKFTKGPWATRETSTHITVVGEDGEVIFHDDKRIPRVVGDARLISAAPELLALLQDCVEIQRDGYGDAISTHLCLIGWSEKARALIEKATGGKQ